jgi:ribosomal protein S11
MAKKIVDVSDSKAAQETAKVEKAPKAEKKEKASKETKAPKAEKTPKKAQTEKALKEETPKEAESREPLTPVGENAIKEVPVPKPEEPRKQGKKGLVHIYSSGNNTIIHITDVTGADTISRVSGGMVTKQDRLKGAPFQAMLAAGKAIDAAVAQGVTDVDILVRAPGGHREMEIGKGAEQAI